MASVTVTPVDDFDHNTISAKRGVSIEIPQALAEDFERRGLVTMGKAAPKSSNKMAPEPANKGNEPAAGEDATSSASQAAPASAPTTAKRSTTGANTTAKRGR